MKINFTKKEYSTLIDFIYIGDWILHSHCIGEEGKSQKHIELQKKVYSYAQDYEASDKLQYYKDLGGYYENRDYEDYARETFIEPYDQEHFWEELTWRLADRDLLQKYGAQKLEDMPFQERMSEHDLLREKYNSEFEKNGLANLNILKIGASTKAD